MDQARFRSHHLPQVGTDIAGLRDVQLQKLALIRIGQLAADEIHGKRLRELPAWPAALGNCWSLYFDKVDDVIRPLNRPAPRFRIVYRYLPPTSDPGDRDRRPRLQVLAVGLRSQAEAYERAAARLELPAVTREPTFQPHDRAPMPPSRSTLPSPCLHQRRALPRWQESPHPPRGAGRNSYAGSPRLQPCPHRPRPRGETSRRNQPTRPALRPRPTRVPERLAPDGRGMSTSHRPPQPPDQ